MRVHSWLPSVLVGVSLSELVLPHIPWTLSGKMIFHIFLIWIVDIKSLSRRMMMTSGSGVNYKSMFDAGSQVIKLFFLDTQIYKWLIL